MGWFKNSGGKSDAMFTLAVLSWVVVTFSVLASLFHGDIKIGNVSFTLNEPNAMLLLGYLGACYTGYVVRRNKKAQLESEDKKHMMENGIIE